MLRGAIRAVCALVACAAGTLPDVAVALTREEAVVRALAENTDVRRLVAEVAAAEALLSADRRFLRSNPVVQGALGTRRTDDDSSPEWAAGLSQEIEIAGQRGDRVAAREAELTAARARLEVRRIAIASDVRQAFGSALAARQRHELAMEAARLATEALAAAREREEAGAAARLETNTARVELGRALRERAVAEQEARAAKAALRQLLVLPPDAELDLRGELGEMADAPAAVLEAAIASERADVMAARRRLAAAEAAAELAASEGFPDLTLGATYAEEESDRIVQGTLAVPIPIFDRNQAARARARLDVAQARTELDAVQRQAGTDLDLAIARYETARETVRAFGEDALEALQENLQMINEAYEAGKVDFLQLLLVRRETIASRLAWIESLEELDRAEADLLRALGRVE